MIKRMKWTERRRGLWTCGSFDIIERMDTSDVYFQLCVDGYHLGYYQDRLTAGQTARKFLKKISHHYDINRGGYGQDHQ